MSSAFADTYNMVAILTKSDAIKHLTDVTRLQALVDRKKVVISEAVIREVLCLDDAEGVDCLPNKEIFTGLARIGYEKPSTKLTFYKAFFSSQWKFLIHTILQSMSAKQTSWNEFSSAMASAGMLVVREDVEAYIGEEHVPDNTAVVAAQEIVTTAALEDVLAAVLEDTALDACATLTLRVEHLEHDKKAQTLEITKLKKRVKKLERVNKRRMIVELDRDKGVELIGEKEKTKEVKDIVDSAQVEGRQADKQAKIYQIDLDHPSKVVSMQEDDSEVQEAVEVVFANMSRIGKGFSGVETPLFEGMLVVREDVEAYIGEEHVPDNTAVVAAQEIVTTAALEDVLAAVLEDTALDACATLTLRVEHLEHDKKAQTLEITKLKKRVKKLERVNKVKAFKLRRLKKVGTSQRVKSSDDTIIEDVSN
nr:hypothetical protein [Tanacetum cinerariifolium]